MRILVFQVHDFMKKLHKKALLDSTSNCAFLMQSYFEPHFSHAVTYLEPRISHATPFWPQNYANYAIYFFDDC